MNRLIKKALPVLLATVTFTTPSAMAVGNPMLVAQQLGSAHTSKAVAQNAQQKEQVFKSGLNKKLNISLEKSMQDLQDQIDQSLAKKLNKA